VCQFDDGCTVIAAANGSCQHARRPLITEDSYQFVTVPNRRLGDTVRQCWGVLWQHYVEVSCERIVPADACRRW
jgi:hypothetical protein